MRDRLIELLSHKQQYGIATEEPPEALYTIENHQVADYLLANGVIVQKQGKWQDNNNGTFTCSICGGKAPRMNYCGRCGAKLKELKENAT